MARFLRLLVVTATMALALAGVAQAGGGNYVFDGGTPRQQAEVQRALDATSFDWGLVRQQVTVHIGRYDSEATTGDVYLDAGLLDAGVFSWGVVQHEYAHEVDYFLLDPATRATLAQQLGGAAWWPTAGVAHGRLSCERFASTLAWSYWSSGQNSMKPQSKDDESAAMAPTKFRKLLAQLIGAPQPAAATRRP